MKKKEYNLTSDCFIELKINCPECGNSLVTDELFHTHAWCKNKECKLYIHRIPPYDLMFSHVQESFLSEAVEEVK